MNEITTIRPARAGKYWDLFGFIKLPLQGVDWIIAYSFPKALPLG